MYQEITNTIGYRCCSCNAIFEFHQDVANHDHYCSRYSRMKEDNRIVAKKQIAQIKLETFTDDGSHAGIVLQETPPIEIVPDLVAMRRSVKNLIGNWS